MTDNRTATEDQQQNRRKKELTNKVRMLVKTAREKPQPHSMQEGIAAVSHTLYMANIHTLKEFLIDRDCKGEKPRLIVESPYANPETGLTEDRVYMPRPTEYHQEKLDMLKKQQLIPDNSTIEDYSFLFEFNNKEHVELKA